MFNFFKIHKNKSKEKGVNSTNKRNNIVKDNLECEFVDKNNECSIVSQIKEKQKLVKQITNEIDKLGYEINEITSDFISPKNPTFKTNLSKFIYELIRINRYEINLMVERLSYGLELKSLNIISVVQQVDCDELIQEINYIKSLDSIITEKANTIKVLKKEINTLKENLGID